MKTASRGVGYVTSVGKRFSPGPCSHFARTVRAMHAKLASPLISSIDAAVALAPQDVVTTLMMGNGVT